MGATALATSILAYAAIKQLPLIAKQVSNLSDQIRLSREAEANAERRDREYRTLEAIQRYAFDPVLDAAIRRIRDASNEGEDYRRIQVKKFDLVCVLNYLDTIATGIEQGLYIEDMVKDHMSPVFHKYVTEWIKSGIVGESGFRALVELHGGWARQNTAYRSGGVFGTPAKS